MDAEEIELGDEKKKNGYRGSGAGLDLEGPNYQHASQTGFPSVFCTRAKYNLRKYLSPVKMCLISNVLTAFVS